MAYLVQSTKKATKEGAKAQIDCLSCCTGTALHLRRTVARLYKIFIFEHSKPPRSNGKVGTVGTSYSGATQHAIGITNAPSLAAMVPVDAMSNAGQFGVRHNGAFELRWLNWIFSLGNATGLRASATGLAPTPNGALAAARAASSPEAAGALQELGTRMQEYALALPLRPGHHAAQVRARVRGLADRGDGPRRQRRLLAQHGLQRRRSHRRVPGRAGRTTSPAGTTRGAAQVAMNYVALSKAKKSPQRLIVGPWTHGGQSAELLGRCRVRPGGGASTSTR